MIAFPQTPKSARAPGYTWRFVNRDGGPDRRFNNNRQIPKVLYQQMGLQGTGRFQKILHISKVEDRGEFDTALSGLRVMISCLERDAPQIKDRQRDHVVQSEASSSPQLFAPPTQVDRPSGEQSEQPENIRKARSLILPLLMTAVGTVFAVVLTLGLYFRFSAPSATGPTAPVALAPPMTTVVPSVKRPPTKEPAAVPPASAVRPSFNCGTARRPLAVTICADPALSLTDLRYVQAYQALRQASIDDKKSSVQKEASSFVANVEARCGLSSQGPPPPLTEQLRSCISTAYDKQRSEWVVRLPPVAIPEVSRPIDQHIALQRNLAEVGFLPASASIDGIYGPATRGAILAWQRSRGRPTTAFLSNEEAKQLSDEAATLYR